MKFKLGILALLFSFNCFAHKDKVIGKTYGNVKIYMKTGFDYSDIEKIKIVGQLSEKLSDRLSYKDTIFIEYVQDYTDNYADDLYLLEYNNSNYKIATGIKSDYTIESNDNGLSVRIYADRIKIVDVLKLVEFTIINKEKTNSFLTKKSIGFNVYEDQELLEPLVSIATEDEIIKQIISSKSEIVENIITNKILVNSQKPYGMEIYWQNGKFIFEYNHIQKNKQEFVFEIEDYYYHLYVNVNDILIFVDKNSFYFLDGTDDKPKKLINIDIGGYAPIRTMDFGDKILFQSYRNQSNINIFVKETNKVISKFE
ncbi:hypothetical protein ACFSSB_15590 [Lacinutrix gracilariae]|uniref:Uncharacterized protein n=1 Tax=Lacinutrix gracilariae TaxID=1747198 RepID=A0ABW5K4A8_9FLAO